MNYSRTGTAQNTLRAIWYICAGFGALLAIPTLFSGFGFMLFGEMAFGARVVAMPITMINCALRIFVWPFTLQSVLSGETSASEFFFYHRA